MDAARRVLTVMCKIFCRHAVVASELTRELTLGATAYGGGAGRAFGHADPAAAGGLGGLALSNDLLALPCGAGTTGNYTSTVY